MHAKPTLAHTCRRIRTRVEAGRRLASGFGVFAASVIACGSLFAQTMKLGVGTSTVPHGGIGGGIVAVEGLYNSYDYGPHLQFTTDADNYPVYAISPMRHDNILIRFDAWYDTVSSQERTSSTWAPCRIQKNANHLQFQRAQSYGSANQNIQSWLPMFLLDLTSGKATFYADMYCSGIVGDPVGSYAQLLIDTSNGRLGTQTSSIRYKKNVRDLGVEDTEWVYSLRPRHFDYKDPARGTNQIGLIAEEVEEICPRLVIYKVAQEPREEALSKLSEEPATANVRIPDGVRYDQLIVPLLAEVQQLRKTVGSLQAQVAELQAGK